MEEAATKKRNKWLAALLSYFCIGLGQLYCGNHRRAIFFLFIFATILAIAASVFLLPYGIIILLPVLTAGLGFYIFNIVDAWIIARRVGVLELRRYNSWYVYAVIILAVNLPEQGLKIEFRDHWPAYHSPSGSMIPTMEVGDYWFARTANFEGKVPERGSVIVYRHPKKPGRDNVKRLIGLPGETVQIRHGELHINDNRIDRQKIREMDDGSVQYQQFLSEKKVHVILEDFDDGPSDNTQKFIVPEDHVFVLGDNRDQSADSRYQSIGTIPISNITGIAKIIYWSEDLSRIGKWIE